LFTNLKIEADKWPWSTLLIAERVDKATWIQMRDTIPTIMPQKGISSGHDTRYTFKDTYVDLSLDAERLGHLSEDCDGTGRGYLA
jgi:hypothetical protein